ncbi:histone-lysine N-methyltransferase ASHH2 [Aristolochia californica]|uniref:histone-lysine N-methyltransferase ASHH2 n=1 Tax=Aristolochia californica TaxID=171875 RepID=UPI0035E0C451
MSSGIEIEDSRVPVLFEKASELLIVASEGSMPAGQRALGPSNCSQTPDWDPNNDPEEVLSVSFCNSPHIASVEVVGPVAGEYDVNCEGVNFCAAQNPSNRNWFPEENEQEEPVVEREAFQTFDAEEKGSDMIVIACSDPLKESPGSTDLFEHSDIGTSEQLPLSIERLQIGLETGDASGNSIRRSGSASQDHELRQSDEGKSSFSAFGSIILRSKNEKKVLESSVASLQLNSFNILQLGGCTSQKLFSEFDQNHDVSMLNLSRPSIIGFEGSEGVDGSPRLSPPNGQQKGAILEAEESQTLGTEKKPSNSTSNACLGLVASSLVPVLSTMHPININTKQFPLLACDNDGCISCESDAQSNSLVVEIEGMGDLGKEPRVVALQSSWLQGVERKVVGEFSAVEVSNVFQFDEHKTPVLEDERLQTLVDIGIEAQTVSIGRMDDAGKPLHLSKSASSGICVVQDGHDTVADKFLTVVKEGTSMVDAEGEQYNLTDITSCGVSSNSGSPLVPLELVSPSNFSPREQKRTGTEFPTVWVERSEISKMEEQKCPFDVAFSHMVEASAASLKSSQVVDDVLGPISSSLSQSKALACEESGSLPRVHDNGAESSTIRSDGRNPLEPGGGNISTCFNHEDNAEVTVLESESAEEIRFQKLCTKTNLKVTDVDSHCTVGAEPAPVFSVVCPCFNNVKQVVVAFGNDTKSSMAESDDMDPLGKSPTLSNVCVPKSEQVGTVTEFLVLEEKRPRMSHTELAFCCSAGVTSCSILEDVGDTLCVGSTYPRRSPRLTRMGNAARQCGNTLEAIAISLRKSRKKRSSFCKRTRNSTWGELQNIEEAFAREWKIVDSKFGKVPKNKLRKGRGGIGERRRQKKIRTKGCSRVSKKKQRNTTNQIHLKLKIDEQLVLPRLPGFVDSPASIQTILNDDSPELGSFTAGLKLDNKLGTSLDSNPEKLSGELSRDKDLESTLTQETSLENNFGEFHGVSSQTETQISMEAFYNRDLDPATSPDSNVFDKIPSLTEMKSAVCTMSETANQSDSGMWPSPDLDVLHLVPVPDAVERENGGDEGESQEMLVNGTLTDSQAVVPPESVLPLNVRQNRKKKENKNKNLNDAQCLPSVENGCLGSENMRLGRIQSRYRRQRKARGKTESRKQEIGMHSSESKCSNSGILKSESPISEMVQLEICRGVSIVEAGPESQGIPSQDDQVKAYAASRISIAGHTKEIIQSPDSMSPVGKNARRQKGPRQKSNKRKVKKGIAGQDVLKEDNTSQLSNSTSCKRDGEVIEDEVIYDSIVSSKMLPVGGEQQLEIQPRAAWVRCDDCYKWRCISAELADEIEETNCRWTCMENADKRFADCSIPQEKSNAEINAELEISDASGDEDSRCQQLSSKQFESRQLMVAQQASWTLIKHNIFLHRSPKTQTIDEVMVCHCMPPSDGSLGCGDECLNRMLNIECVQGTCPCGDLCSNQQFQKHKYAKLVWFRSGKKGYGLRLLENVSRGNFLIEYVGEVLDLHNYEARQRDYASRGQKHFYFMTLNGSEIIDACAKGNLGRFINHSCEPNCRTEKWMVNGEVCIGLFALRDIKKGEEVTFDYNYVRVFGAAAKKCHCGSSECQGYIGGDPSNTEAIVQVDSDDEYPEPVMLCEDGKAGVNLYETSRTEYSWEKLDSTIGCLPSSNLLKLENSWQKTDNLNRLHSGVQHVHVSLPLEGKDTCEPVLIGEKSEISSQVECMGRSSLPSEEFNSVSSPTALPYMKVPKENVMEETCGASQPSETNLLETMSKSATVEDNCKPIKYTVENKPEIVKTSTNVKSSRSLSSIKKGKISATKFLSCKPKRPLEGSSSSRFEGVEDKLSELVDADGGISKRKDATKGYLKLLFVTAASGDNIKGETSQSTRDLSIVLDALLKTKSRSVLVDIINKNGLQMLHNIMKQNRRNFNKIPIIRKLLKVIEYLGVKEILTFEHVNIPPPCAGMESFKESIIVLTRHNDIRVHQMARNFRDRWFPRTIRKVYSDRDESRLDYHNHSHVSHKRWHDQGARPSNAIQCIGQTNNGPTVISSSQQQRCSAALNASAPQELCPVTASNTSYGTKRTRKRKSRWDQPEETNLAQPPEPIDAQVVDPNLHCEREVSLKQAAICEGVQNRVCSVKAETTFHHVGDGPDAPPGFSSSVSDSSNMSSAACPSTTMGQPQPRYLAHLPVSYGIPWTLVQEFGITNTKGGDHWEVAPGVPFHPFPPLPPYPLEATGFGEEIQRPQGCCLMASPDVLPTGANNLDGNERIRCTSSGEGLGRRYFKQQKWNNNRGNRLLPWVRRRGWGSKGNSNNNYIRSLNSAVCVENVRDEYGRASSKESVTGKSGDCGGPCFKESLDENSSCSVDSGNNAAFCQ